VFLDRGFGGLWFWWIGNKGPPGLPGIEPVLDRAHPRGFESSRTVCSSRSGFGGLGIRGRRISLELSRLWIELTLAGLSRLGLLCSSREDLADLAGCGLGH
jgi:hypothetical protein